MAAIKGKYNYLPRDALKRERRTRRTRRELQKGCFPHCKTVSHTSSIQVYTESNILIAPILTAAMSQMWGKHGFDDVLHCGLIIVSRSRGRTCFGFGVEARRVLESGGGEGQAAALPQAVLQHRLELGAQADHPARRRRPVTGHWTAGWFSCLNSRLHFKLDACNVICGFPVER